jgi:hypothetical protein
VCALRLCKTSRAVLQIYIRVSSIKWQCVVAISRSVSGVGGASWVLVPAIACVQAWHTLLLVLWGKGRARCAVDFT